MTTTVQPTAYDKLMNRAAKLTRVTYIALLTLALVAWIVGMGENTPSWQQWLPEVQSILSRHFPFEPRLPNFTLTMSLAYNALSAMTLMYFSATLSCALPSNSVSFFAVSAALA